MTILSYVFALIAALLFALSASLQQSAARSTALAGRPSQSASTLRRGLAFLISLLRQPLWLAGLMANVTGFVVHALALHLGPIPVIQALLVVQLLFALPLAAWRRRIKLLRTDWLGTTLVCAGLSLLVAQRISHGGVRRSALPYGVVAAVCLVLLLVAVGSRLPRQRHQLRAALLGLGAGCCSATTAVLVVVATSDLPHVGWPALAIVVSTLASGLLAQAAFASGSLPTALTAMTVTDPAVSYVAAISLFYGATHPHPLALGGAAALVTAGVVLLANSPTLHDEKDHTAVIPARSAV